MKLAIVLAHVFACRVEVAAFSWRHAKPAPAPAPGPAAAPAPSINALHLSFEIENFNYLDLTKQTCPTAVKQSNASSEEGKKDADWEDPLGDPEKVGNVVNEISDKAYALDKDIGNGMADIITGKNPKIPENPEKKYTPNIKTLLQANACVLNRRRSAALESKSGKCEMVADVFRDAITEVIKDIIHCMDPARSPMPAPPGIAAPASAFLQIQSLAPSPGVAASPASAGQLGIFVNFKPGREVGKGQTIIVEIIITDAPGNGIDDIAKTDAIMQQALATGNLRLQLEKQFTSLTGLRPSIVKITVTQKPVEEWQLAKCEGHLKSLIKDFARTYSRERVPMALYNECTNFMSRLSFSHDLVLDALDTQACRDTTVKLAKELDSGKEPEDKDFEPVCLRACESKFGKDAPKCNVKALSAQPL